MQIDYEEEDPIEEINIISHEKTGSEKIKEESLEKKVIGNEKSEKSNPKSNIKSG